MGATRQLFLQQGLYPGLAEKNNEQDVIILKRALDRLGYHVSRGIRPTPFAGNGLFSAVRKFQKDHNLVVDGTIWRLGKTSLLLSDLLAAQMASGDSESIDLPDDGGVATPEQCDDLLDKIDGDVCNGITRQRGKAAGERCWASANDRYAHCLAGKRLDEMPPLNVWAN